jgi:hypothetical protein
MQETIRVQGRPVTPADVEQIREWISDYPQWSRRRLSEQLCQKWDWRNGAGRLKDMAARTLLLKLEARGLIVLPPRRQPPSIRMAERTPQPQAWDRRPIRDKLGALQPLKVREVSRDEQQRHRLAAAWSEFHYLGYRGTVGENLQYTICDAEGRLLAGLLFGSAAWKCRARDEVIGWSSEQRRRHLYRITNNSRFLVLPWVQVPHLASWSLGTVLRRLSSDWQEKYGHGICLVETFVDAERFAGTCYRAANWRRVGQTSGRSRQDRRHRLQVPVKDIYLYPLARDWRGRLCL